MFTASKIKFGLGVLTLQSVAASLGSRMTDGAAGLGTRDLKPNFPYDPATISPCTWWEDNDGSLSCKETADIWGLSIDDFRLMNPSITPDCGNFITGQSYCIESWVEAAPTVTTNPTPTSSPSGVVTPSPQQPDMVKNCDKFYFVRPGDTCNVIAGQHGITAAQLIKWNPSVGSDCTNLWAYAYTCVHVVGP
ncbi:uncharacterized protein B0I36DRAFT_363419 [Microdochium trichocladiopsis]|uniref:LysM domain-containing protein n=1 Tax=Microdochium trichocladiopsis TaxID=1682393 RepID=A0A9P9BP09_9PEZI|nr:uncharacterized protein B0I36DRAFT_363419 [Microdochium trichocladiopsis]KAH7028794.1 hypothetical protein B0I36DRAFT_363419 [Microdochium trichocladiopsis]